VSVSPAPAYSGGPGFISCTRLAICTEIFCLFVGLSRQTGHDVAQWLRHYATSRKVVNSRPDEMIFFFFFCNLPNLPAALGPGVYSASNRNEYQKQENNVSGK
jgi:hypothetical protein